MNVRSSFQKCAVGCDMDPDVYNNHKTTSVSLLLCIMDVEVA